MAVRILLEIGHEATLRTKKTPEGFTHDWEVFVRGCDNADIHYYVDKVVFHLHETFPKPKRVVKEPPYLVKESGYAGFNLPIDIYLRNNGEPKKIRFNYDLHLQQTGPAIYKTQKEKYVFQNVNEEFKSKLLKGGGVFGSGGQSDSNDSRSSLLGDDRNAQMISKPKLSGSMVEMNKSKKIKSSGESRDFQDLFGSPITYHQTKPQPPKTSTSEIKTSEKSKSTSSKHASPHNNLKDSHKDKDNARNKSDDKKNKDGASKKSKDKNRSADKNSRTSSDKTTSSKKERTPSPPPPPPPPPPPQRFNKEEKPRDKDRQTEKKSSKKDRRHSKERRRNEEDVSDHHNHHRDRKERIKNDSRNDRIDSPPPAKPPPPPPTPEKKEKSVKESKKEQDRHSSKHKAKNKDKDREKHALKKDEAVVQTKPKKSDKFDIKQFTKTSKKEKEHATPAPPQFPSQSRDDDDDDSSSSASSDSSSSSSSDSSLSSQQTKPIKVKEEPVVRVKKEKRDKVDQAGGIKCKRKPSPPRQVVDDLDEPPGKIAKEEVPSDVEDVKPNKNAMPTVLQIKKEDEDYYGILRDLQNKIMSLKDNADLQKVVQLIAETGRYEVSASTFDFDLCLLDRSTVRQLQDFFDSET